MGKIFASASAAVVIALMAMLEATTSTTVHFDLTHMDCENTNNSIAVNCTQLLKDAFANINHTLESTCIKLQETLACIETALCHCNYSRDHYLLAEGSYIKTRIDHFYNNASHCSNASLAGTIQPDVLGPIEADGSINCTKYNSTVGDLALTFAAAHHPMILALEQTCEGIYACYAEYDEITAIALYSLDFAVFCGGMHDLMECIVTTTCACNQTTDQSLLFLLEAEKAGYRHFCGAVVEIAESDEVGIDCSHNCGTLNPSLPALLLPVVLIMWA